MKKLSVITILVLFRIFSYGQYKLPLTLNNDTTNYKYPPLWIIKTPDKHITKLLGNINLDMINPDFIASLMIIKNGTKQYGYLGRYGVVELIYKKNITDTFINPDNLTQLIGKTKLSKKINLLPVYVDSVLIIHPENAFIARDKIVSIKLEKEKASGIKFINVLTVNPQKKYTNTTAPSDTTKSKIIYIRGIAANK